MTGEPFRFRFHFSAVDDTAPLTLRMNLRASDGTRLAGATTDAVLDLIGPFRSGTHVDYLGGCLPLAVDSYMLTTELHDDLTGDLLDQVDHAAVEVHPGVDRSLTAMVSLGGTWTMT